MGDFVGDLVGDSVYLVGDEVGLQVCLILVGAIEGAFDGLRVDVGLYVVNVGDFVGGGVFFFFVGALVGLCVLVVGEEVGAAVSPSFVGLDVGLSVTEDGDSVGYFVGLGEGDLVGDLVGLVGDVVGDQENVIRVGPIVGLTVFR